MKHTPGPWEASRFTKPDGTVILTATDVVETLSFSAIQSDRAELFGVTIQEADNSGRNKVVCYTGNGPTSEANARLIAITPELLEACKDFLSFEYERGVLHQSHLEKCMCRVCIEKRAEAIIQKVEGRP